MKKSLLAIAAMTAFAGAAQAQSSVTLYGTLDIGVGGQTNGAAINNNYVGGMSPTSSSAIVAPGTGQAGAATTPYRGNTVGVIAGGQSANALGFMGSEDIGGGNKVIFKLEQGFNLASGALGQSGLNGTATTAIGGFANNTVGDTSSAGQLFSRAAWLGIKTSMGTITAGRQNSVLLDQVGKYDPVAAQFFSPISFSGNYGGGAQTDMARLNNSIKFANTYGGYNVSALVASGGYAGTATGGSTAQFSTGYDNNLFGIQASATHSNDATSMVAGLGGNSVNVQYMNTTAFMLTGLLKATDKLTLKAGYENWVLSPASNYAYDAGLTNIYNYTANNIGEVIAPKRVNTFWIGANYQLTPVIKTSVGGYRVVVPQYNAVTASLASIATPVSIPGAATSQYSGTYSGGAQNYLSTMVEYSLSKRTNLYAAYAYTADTGNQVGGSHLSVGSPVINTWGMGMRHTF